MKYTKEQYDEQIANLKIGVKMFQMAKDNFESEWRKKMFEQNEYKQILLKLKEYETELETFKREHYSDFRVRRLDRKTMRR